jgi:hypothetical protein
MPTNLTTYLHDHLAGAQFATSLLSDLSQQQIDEPLARFAAELLVEIEEDQQTLEGFLSHLDSSPSVMKEASAWLTQKAARMKLQLSSDPFSQFETLELLSLGILGKAALWKAIQNLSLANDLDFPTLIDRAARQHSIVEELRLDFAKRVLE